MNLRAEFVLDDDGNPSFYEGARKHYKIRPFVENAPREMQAVTYRLLDTFHDPVPDVFRTSGTTSSPRTSPLTATSTS